jgi:hypothetical protein
MPMYHLTPTFLKNRLPHLYLRFRLCPLNLTCPLYLKYPIHPMSLKNPLNRLFL